MVGYKLSRCVFSGRNKFSVSQLSHWGLNQQEQKNKDAKLSFLKLDEVLTWCWFPPEMAESDIQVLILETKTDKNKPFTKFPREIN